MRTATITLHFDRAAYEAEREGISDLSFEDYVKQQSVFLNDDSAGILGYSGWDMASDDGKTLTLSAKERERIEAKVLPR